MVRAYSSAIILCVVSICLSSALKAQSANSQSRLDAVKAILADFNRQKDLIRKQEELLKQNAKDFNDIEAEMKAVFNASEMTMFNRAVAQVARDQIAQTTTATGQNVDPVGQGLASIEIIKNNLELMQLSSTQMALAQKRIECMENANQLGQTRDSLMKGLGDFQEKLWEFADVSGIYSKEENKAILGAFNSVNNDDGPAVLVRGLLRLNVGETDLAKDDFNLLIDQKVPSAVVAIAARGRLYAKQKETKKSKADFTIAKKLGDGDLYVQWLLGNFAASDGEWKAAENYFQKALKAKKFEQPLHRSLALAIFERTKSKKSNMKDCLEHAEVASRLGTGKDWLSEVAYAAVLNETGDSAGAKTHIENALESCPSEAKKGCEEVSAAIEDKSKVDTSVFWKN